MESVSRNRGFGEKTSYKVRDSGRVLFKVATNMKTRIIYGLLAGLTFSLYWLTWRGAMLFAGILGAYLLVQLIRLFLQRRNYLGVISVLLIGGFLMVLFYGRFTAAFSGLTASATMELASFTLYTAWGNFGLLTFLVPVILVLLVYQIVKRGDTSLILLLVWSVVILVVMLEYRRFAYYFAVNAALLTGWFIWYVWGRLREEGTPFAVIAVAVLCLAVLVPNVQQATSNRAYFNPSDAWCDTLTWVKENTPEDSIILSWWDYGYWINRIGQREAYITPSQQAERITETAQFFLSPVNSTEIAFDYLILDYATTTSKFEGITIWAGEAVELYSPQYYQSLLVRLYQGELSGQYALVYQSEQEIEGIPEVKVFCKRKIIDGQ